jgi:hypothetical protein
MSYPTTQSFKQVFVVWQAPCPEIYLEWVHQSEWTSVTLGDSDMLSAGSVVSCDDSSALLALANALEIHGSWISCMKTLWVP